ncbi:MAG TPA: CoA-binding protein [Bryobacteraceae bacterium]|jgi:predicted CoA-binding protein|nr:CoA-binding protein [Bryobacteraceae bacterium]
MATLTQIQSFLGRKRLAVIGVSRNPRDFTRALFHELQRREYEVVPVNLIATEIDGVVCHARVTDIDPPVDAALLLTSPAVTERVVRECHEAGIRDIWMYRAAGTGAVSPRAVEFCEAHGMSVVAGECPFMFLPETPWFHRVHGFCRKLAGNYPA